MRVKPPSGPEGRWARFLVDQREKAGRTQIATFRLARPTFGWGPDSRAAYGDLERAQRQPSEDEQKYFLKLYGFEKLPPEESVTEELTIARALIELAAELRAARQERVDLGGRLRAVEAELKSLRAQRVGGAPGEQSAPLGSAQ